MEKKYLHLVVIGHIDHGKSSILGRLFYDTDNVPKAVMERIRKTAKILGKEGFEFAFVMDQIKEERARGITIGLAHKKLVTEKHSITFADAPGHRDFIKNMLTGASESNAAILVVAADEGIQSQTKQHLFLTKMLGVPRVAVALNKMDLVDYSQERFKQLKEMIEQLVERVGYNKLDVPIIPCSALEGENVVKRGNKMSWYKGQTLLEHIENLPEVTPPSNLALRLPVQDIYTIEGIPVVIGRIVTGVVKLDDKVRVWPSGREYSVERIYIQDKEVEAGEPGDNLYLYLKGLKQGEIKRGDMITLHNDKPTFATRFKAYVFIINHPTGIVPGYKTRFEMLTESTPCIINALLNKIDTTTGAIVEESPSQLQDKEAALVEIATSKPVYIEPQQHFSNLANFRLIEDDTRVGMGICVEVIE